MLNAILISSSLISSILSHHLTALKKFYLRALNFFSLSVPTYISAVVNMLELLKL
jgi:hypothetical protein